MSGQNGTRNSVVEALILASPEPLPARRVAELMEELTPSQVARAVAELNNRYLDTGSAFRIRELAGGYQFYIIPEFTGYVDELLTRRRKLRLSRAALETLAIVAYRQPVTRAEIEHIRGVASDGVVHNLLEKKLITISGRAETIGRPLQYGTTDEFLKFFGLNSLKDLPQMSEIEELISSRDPESQTELELLIGRDGRYSGHKLNVADGTHDPTRSVNVDASESQPGDARSEETAAPVEEATKEPSDRDDERSRNVTETPAVEERVEN